MSYVQPPVARYMLLCDDVVSHSNWPGKPLIVGLTSLVHWAPDPDDMVLEKLTVFLVLTDGRGKGLGQIVCRNELTDEMIFRSSEQPLSFAEHDPIAHSGIVFRLLDCKFRARGVYNLVFLFNGQNVAEQVLYVR